MKSIYKILVSGLNKKGYVKLDPKTCSNQVFRFLEKNEDTVTYEVIENGLIKILMK